MPENCGSDAAGCAKVGRRRLKQRHDRTALMQTILRLPRRTSRAAAIAQFRAGHCTIVILRGSAMGLGRAVGCKKY